MARDLAPTALAVRTFITAQEGFPELERLFLAAEREIWAGFRIFDLDTRLRSPEGAQIGETWFDLLVHRLKAGVAVHFLLADFDPNLVTYIHAGTARSARRFREAGRAAGGGLQFSAALHPARAGLFWRVVLWPLCIHKLRKGLASRADPRGFLRDSVRLRHRVRLDGNGTPVIARRPMPHIRPGSYHQKLAIFDRKTLFIGGLDVDERRWDDLEHRRPAAYTWQDVSVVTRQEAAVAAAQAHLEALWDPDRPIYPPAPPFIRTLSRDGSRNPFRLSPITVARENEEAHIALFEKAQRLIYIETQFFRSTPVSRALVRAAKHNPDLTLVMMLPAAPEEVAFENSAAMDARYGEWLQVRAIRRVRRAFGERCFIGMPLRRVPRESDGRDTALGADIVYIHSKVAVADDAEAIVTSANLNGRGMRWDTEAGIVIDDGPSVAHLRRRLFEHWLPRGAAERYYDPATASAAWAELAEANARRFPDAREGFIAPYDPRPAERFGVPFPAPEEVV
jgi:phosphatidylserine/phosphatidylglycerophosphate/cardiolipin synthase-like enzyme